jgi:8-amino-7-oxononanoate synthase
MCYNVHNYIHMNLIKSWINSSKVDFTEDQNLEAVYDTLDYVDENDLYPDTRVISSAVEPESSIDGKNVLMFASNNYLGLSTHPHVKKAAIFAIEKYGIGSTGSRLLSGNLDIHLELEKKLAEFKGGEDALVFPTGFAANLGTITALMNPLKVKISTSITKKGVILSDELNHASIVDGVRMSDQEKEIYNHCDLEHLEVLLKKHKNRRKLIVTDSVFSMDGDVAPLDKICELAKKYNAMVMIDEAHAVGVLGENGAGAMEHFRLKTSRDVTVVMGTLSKTIGCTGGYVVGSKKLIKYLRVACRSYMFSTAMSPATAAGAIAAIDLIRNDQSLKARLWDNVAYLKKGFTDLGLKVMNSQSAIIPVLIGEDEKAIKMSRDLFNQSIFAPCVRWPVVPRGESRIRFTVTSEHTKEHLDMLLEKLKIVSSTN